MEIMKRVLALLLTFAMLMPNLATIASAAEMGEEPVAVSVESVVLAEETEATEAATETLTEPPAEETEASPEETEPSVEETEPSVEETEPPVEETEAPFVQETVCVEETIFVPAENEQTEEELVTETLTVEDTFVSGSEYSNDDMFAMYLDRQMYPNKPFTLSTAGLDSLNEKNQNLYRALASMAAGLAANGGSSVYAPTTDELSKMGFRVTMSVQEVAGADSISAITEAHKAKIKEILDLNLSTVVDALLFDLPYDLYWFDKTVGSSVAYSISYSNRQFTISNVKLTFRVASAYQDGSNTTVSKTAAQAASGVVTAAQNVVTANQDKNDYEKLTAYKDYICSQVTYNSAAAKPTYSGGYGDPWQVIYVFDGDSSTNVVCEGYSKAFQYLCDLSDFEDDVESFLVTGYTTGPHMWNIVSIAGRNYMVDVTNTDPAGDGYVSFGEDGSVFLTGTTQGSIAEGYTFTTTIAGFDPLTYTYTYEVEYTDGTTETVRDSINIYGDDADSILNLSDISYAEYLQQQEDQSALLEELANGATLDREVTVTVPATLNSLTVAEGGKLTVQGATVTLTGESYVNAGTIELTDGAKLIVTGNLYLTGNSGVSQERMLLSDSQEMLGTLTLKEGSKLTISGTQENPEGRLHVQDYGNIVAAEDTVSVPNGAIEMLYGCGRQTGVPQKAQFITATITDQQMLADLAEQLHTVQEDGSAEMNYGGAKLLIHQDLTISDNITLYGDGVELRLESYGLEEDRVTVTVEEGAALTLKGCYTSIGYDTEMVVKGTLNNFNTTDIWSGRLICEESGVVNVYNGGVISNHGMVYVEGDLITEAEGCAPGTLENDTPIYASEGVDPFLSLGYLQNWGNGFFDPENNYLSQEIHLATGRQAFMIAYLNQWNYDTLEWELTPVHASKLVVDKSLVLEPFSTITDGSNNIQEGQNADYFFRLGIADGEQDGETAIRYSNTDIQAKVTFGSSAGRSAEGFYSADPTAEGADLDSLWLEEFYVTEENRTFYFYFDSALYRDGTWDITEARLMASDRGTITQVKENLWQITLSEETAANIYAERDFALELYVWYSNGEQGYEGYPGVTCRAPEFGETRAAFSIDGVRYNASQEYQGLFKHLQDENGDWYPVPAEIPGVSYDLASNTLTLNNAELETLHINHHWRDDEKGEEGYDLPDSRFNIELVGSSSISVTNDHAVLLTGDVHLTIRGDGSLTVSMNGDENNMAHSAFEANNSDVIIEGNAKVTVKVSGVGYYEDENGVKQPANLSAIRGLGNDRWLRLRENAALTTEIPDNICTNGYFDQNGNFVEDNGFNGIAFPYIEVNDNVTLNTQTIRVWDEGRGNAYGAYYQNGGTVNISGIPYYNKDNQNENGTVGHYHFSGVEANYGQIDINGGVLNIDITATEAQMAKNTYYHAIQTRGRHIGLNGGEINITANISGTGLKVGEDDWDGGTNAWVDFNNCTMNMVGTNIYRTIVDVAPNGSINFNGGTINAQPADMNIRGYALWRGTQAYFEGSGIHVLGTLEMENGYVSIMGGFLEVPEGGKLVKRHAFMELDNSFTYVAGEMRLENGAFVQSLDYDALDADGTFAQAFVIAESGKVELCGDAYLEVKGTGKVDGICNEGTFRQFGGSMVVDVDETATDTALVTAALFGSGQNLFEDGYAFLDGFYGLFQLNRDDYSKLYVGGNATVNVVGQDAAIITYAPATFEGGMVNAHAVGQTRTVTDEAGNSKTIYPYAVIVENNEDGTNASLNITGGNHYFGTLHEEGYGPCVRGLSATKAPVTFAGGAVTIDAEEMAIYNVADGTATTVTVPVIVNNETGEALELTYDETLKAYTLTGKVGFLVSQNCGENVTWKLENGVLTISGTGAMDDYHMPISDPASWRTAPWYPMKESITKVVVEEGVTDIGDWAFGRLQNLTEVVYPSTVTSIDMTSSYDCPMLEKFTVAEGNKTYSTAEDGKVLIENGSLVRSAVKSITSYRAGDGITTIGLGAFDSSALEELDLNQVTTIQNYAFADCYNLKSVVIPEGVTTIELTVFQNSGLESITIPASVTKIRNYAFDGCTSLANVTYMGSESQWNTIVIGSGNNALTSLPITFMGTSEETAGEPYLSYHLLKFSDQGYYEDTSEKLTELTVPVGFYTTMVVYSHVWNEEAQKWEHNVVDPAQLYGEDLNIGLFRNYTGIAIEEGEPNGANFFEMAATTGWGETKNLCYKLSEDVVLTLPIMLNRFGVGFYSEDPTNLDGAQRNAAWLNLYRINPNVAGDHSVYFALTESADSFSSVTVGSSNLSAEDLAKVQVTQINPSVYRITLPNEVAAKIYEYRGIPIEVTYTIGEKTETVEFVFGSVSFAGECYNFVINGVWYEYYPGLEGYFSWDEQNQQRLAYKQLPGGITYDYENDVLTMTNSSIASLQLYWNWHDENTGNSGYATKDNDLVLKLVGENKIINPNSNSALAVGDGLTLTITGDANSSLLISATNENATANSYSQNAVNIYNGADLIIAGDTTVTTSVSSGGKQLNNAWLMNIWAGGNNSITIQDNATLNTTVPEGARDDGDGFVNGYEGIGWFGELRVQDNAKLNTSTLTLGEYHDENNAFCGKGSYVQTGGTVTVEALGFTDHEGNRSYRALVINGGTDAFISGGKLLLKAKETLTAKETESLFTGIQANGYLEISGEDTLVEIQIPHEGAAIDVAHTEISIRDDATVKVVGNGQNNHALLVNENGNVQLNGGKVDITDSKVIVNGGANLEIHDGELSVVAKDHPSQTYLETYEHSDFKLHDGTVVVDNGITADTPNAVYMAGYMELNGGTMRVSGTNALCVNEGGELNQNGTVLNVKGFEQVMTVGNGGVIHLNGGITEAVLGEKSTEVDGGEVDIGGLLRSVPGTVSTNIINTWSSAVNVYDGGRLEVNDGHHTFRVDGTPGTDSEGNAVWLGALDVNGEVNFNGGIVQLNAGTGGQAIFNRSTAEGTTVSFDHDMGAVSVENGISLAMNAYGNNGDEYYYALCNAENAAVSSAKITRTSAGSQSSWRIEKDGTKTTLIISGSENMYNYYMPQGEQEADWEKTPWYDYTDQITHVVVEDGINHIGDWVFARMPNLVNVKLPGSVTSISTSAFYDCTAMQNFTMQETDHYRLDGTRTGPDADGYYTGTVIIENGWNILLATPAVTAYTVPLGISEIGSGAFRSCTNLTSITFETDDDGCSSVWNIGSNAFEGTDLTKIELPQSVKAIGASAFADCTNVTAITLPESVNAIRGYAFSGCGSTATTVTFLGNESQWNQISIGSGNGILDRVTFQGTAAEGGDDYLSFRWLNYGENGWEENEHQAGREMYAYAGTTTYGVFYYNHWDGSSWTAEAVIPTGDDSLTIAKIDDAMLKEFGWKIAEGETNSEFFVSVAVAANAWDTETDNNGIVTYNGITLDIQIHRDECGFYSGTTASDETWLNEYEMNPLKPYGNVFYFIFENSAERTMVDSSFHIWNHNGIPDSCFKTQDIGAGIFKITLDSVFLQDVWKYGGFQLWAGFDVTINGSDQPEYKEFKLDMRPMDLGNPDAIIQINDMEYLYFKDDNGWMTHGDPANDWRPGVAIIPTGVSYDYTSNTLTLSGVNLNNLSLCYKIYDENGNEQDHTWLYRDDLKLNLIDSNVIESGHRSALSIDGGLKVTVTGSGSLRLHSHNDPETRDENGNRYAFDTLVVENGSVLNIAGGNVTAEITGEGYWNEGNPAMLSALTGQNGSSLVISDGSLTTVVPENSRDNGPKEVDFENYYSTRAINGFDSISVSGGTLNTSSLYVNDGASYEQTGGIVNITGLGYISRQQDGQGNQYQSYHYNGIQLQQGAKADISGGELNLTVTPKDWECGGSYYNGLSIAGGEATIRGTAKIHVTGAYDGNAISVGHDYDENGQPKANGSLTMTDGTVTVSNTQSGSHMNGVEVGENCIANITGGTLNLNPDKSLAGINNMGKLTIGAATVNLNDAVCSSDQLTIDGATIHVNREEGSDMYAWDIVPGTTFDFKSGTINAQHGSFWIGGVMNIGENAALVLKDSDFHADGEITLDGGSLTMTQSHTVDNLFLEEVTDEWGNTWDTYEHQSRLYVAGLLNLNSGKLELTNVPVTVENSAVVNQNGAEISITNEAVPASERRNTGNESNDWIASVDVNEDAELNINGGSFVMENTNVDGGLNLRGNLNMRNGTMRIAVPDGLGIAARGQATVSGGEMILSGYVGYEQAYEEGFEQGKLTVTGGKIVIDAVNTGMDLYNNMVVTGGDIDIKVSGYQDSFTDENGETVTMLGGLGISGYSDDANRQISISINGGSLNIDAPVDVPAGCNAVSVFGILGGSNTTVRINGGDVGIKARTALYAESQDNAKHLVINSRMHVLSLDTGNTLDISSGIVEFTRDDVTYTWYVDTYEEDETWTSPYDNAMMDGYAKNLRLVSKIAGTNAFWDMEDGVLTITAISDKIGSMVKNAGWNYVADKVTSLILDPNVEQPEDLTQDLFPNLQYVKTPCHMAAAKFTGVTVELIHDLVDGKCQKCEYSEVEEELIVFTDTVNHSVLYKDKVQIQYHFNLADSNVEATKFGALIWTAAEYEAELEAFGTAKTGKTQYTSDNVYDVELVKQSGRYRADNEGQKPRELHVEYYAVPYAIVDGKYFYGNADLYSVQQYADDILTKSSNVASRNTVEAMMRFAKYTQIYLGDTENVSVFESVLSKHGLATNVEWTDSDASLLKEQIVVTQPEYSTNFTAWAGTSLLMKDQTGLGFVLKGQFEDTVEVLYWNESDYADNSTSLIKGTESGVLETIAYSTKYDQALKSGISARLSEDVYYVRMYNTTTGEYSEVKADSVATNLTRMVNKYSDGSNDKALYFAQAYLKYAATAKAYLGN